jgi:hypothetical protein
MPALASAALLPYPAETGGTAAGESAHGPRGRVPFLIERSGGGPAASSPQARPAGTRAGAVPEPLRSPFGSRRIEPRDSLAYLALRVQFDDLPFATAPDTADYHRNEIEHVREYYLGASRGLLDLNATLLDTIFTAAQPAAYYGADADEEERVVELVREVLALADPLVDLAAYDTYLILHAGAGQETDILDNSREQIASGHYGPEDLEAIHGEDPGSPFIATEDTLASGDTLFVDNFMIGPETAIQDGQFFGTLGIYARLVGTALGMIPLHDPTPPGAPDSWGVGAFGLMGWGFFNVGGLVPGFPCAFNRYLMGWIDPVVVEDDADLRLGDINDPAADTAAVLVPVNEREYFLLVNRQHDEDQDSLFSFSDPNHDYIPQNEESFLDMEFDFFLTVDSNIKTREENPYLPGRTRVRTVTGSGVYVWHVNEEPVLEYFRGGSIPNSDGRNKGVDLEEADGIQDMDAPGGAYRLGSFHDSFRAGNRTEWTPSTAPGSESAAGAATGIAMTDVSPSGPVMTARVEFGRRDRERRFSFEGRGGPFHVADLDGDDSLEVVVPADSGSLFLIRPDGQAYRDRDGDPATLDASIAAAGARWIGPPAVGDADGDGMPEIVASDAEGAVWAWNGEDLTELVDGDGDTSTVGLLRGLDPLLTPPLLLQADGDPGLEIAVAAADGESVAVHLLDGSTGGDQDPLFGGGWPRRVRVDRISNLARARVVGTGGWPASGLFVAGWDDSAGTARLHFLPTGAPGEPPPPDWASASRVVDLGPLGEPVPGAALAAGDMDGREGDEAVCVFASGRVAFIGSTGRVTVVPVGDGALSGPALVDVEGDGTLEVALLGESRVHLYEFNGAPATGFPRSIEPPPAHPPAGGVPASGVAGPEAPGGGRSVVFALADGRLVARRESGLAPAGWPLGGEAGTSGAPAIADVDGDGALDLVSLGPFGTIAGVTGIRDSVLTREITGVRIVELGAPGPGGGWRQALADAANSARAVGGPLASGTGAVEPGSFFCYPNPVTGRTARVRVILNGRSRVEVEFYNVEGERAGPGGTFDANPSGSPGTPFDREFDLMELASGVYLCRIEVVSLEGRGDFTGVFTLAVRR